MDAKKDFFKKNQINIKKEKSIIKDNQKDENGNIILKSGTFLISRKSIAKFNFSNGWIFLAQPGLINRQGITGQMALVKSYISEKCPEYYTGTDEEITRANNFVLPEIAKQFQLNAAEYYNVIFEDCNELESSENYVVIGNYRKQKILPYQRYMLSPSFLQENEEMIHLADILENSNELRVSKMLSSIENYLKIRHFPETDIESIKKEFIKQCIFNKYIDFSDEHNLNAGIIVRKDSSGSRARYAPCYDLDFAAGVYNIANGGVQPRTFFRKSDDGKFSLFSILNQFKGDFEKAYLRDIMSKINIEDAIKIGQKYGNFELSEKARNKYNKFFKAQQQDLEEFYNMTYGQKRQNER